MLRLGCGGWVTETGDAQLPLLDTWQVQPQRGVCALRVARGRARPELWFICDVVIAFIIAETFTHAPPLPNSYLGCTGATNGSRSLPSTRTRLLVLCRFANLTWDNPGFFLTDGYNACSNRTRRVLPRMLLM
jgi:hypothetical protein